MGEKVLMQLSGLDFFIIGLYLVFSLGVGIVFFKRAGKSIEEYFISGRALPWWIAGTSMVATTFAADTPLAVTGIVIKNGIAGNWVWWNLAIGGMLTVFLYARLWRRARVITDVELIELRYGGKPAAFLRGFRSLYIGILLNCIIVGWVVTAMVKVIQYTVGGDPVTILVVLLVVTGIYSILSGMWGVVITDFFQFFIAMGGCIVLAVLAVKHVGGIDGLESLLQKHFGSSEAPLSFFPALTKPEAVEQVVAWMPWLAFFTFVGVTWWASWYPGAEPGGGGYVVQRMASCKNEKHSLLATLWFQVAMFALRPWPWILVGLAALVTFPELRTAADADPGYPMMMTLLLGSGLRGLLLVAFFAAFMSTISTQLNWGASYIVNDFYKRFLHPQAAPRHYTTASRITTLILLVVGGLVSTQMGEIQKVWKFMLAIGAGTGLVLLLRWYWWRISAWSEIASMVAALVISTILFAGFPKWESHVVILITAGATTFIWLLVTFLTPPEDTERLKEFYRKVRPGGVLWGRVKRLTPEVTATDKLAPCFVGWILSAGMVYSILFGIGKLVLGRELTGIILILIGLGLGVLTFAVMRKLGWEKVLK